MMKWVAILIAVCQCCAGSDKWIAQRPSLSSDYGNFFISDTIDISLTPFAWLPFPAPFVSTQYCFGISCTNDFLVSGAVWATNSGMRFDGVDDRLSRAAGMSLNGKAGATFAMWVYPQSGGADIGFHLLNNRTANGYVVFINNTNSASPRAASLLIDTATGDYRQGTTANNVIEFDKWVHLVFRYNGSFISIYTNAVSLALTENGGTGNIVDDGNACYIGDRAASDRSTRGWIDNLLVFDRALTPLEITNLYFSVQKAGTP